MKTLTEQLIGIAAVAALAGACVVDDTEDTGADTEADTEAGMTAGTMTTAATMTTAGDDDGDDTTADGGTMEGGTLDDTAGDTAEDSGSGEAGSSEGTTGTAEMFIFNEADPGDYEVVDRMAFPAVNTGLNLTGTPNGDKDAYNAETPVDDAAGAADGEPARMVDALNTLHRGLPGEQTANNTGLDDDLIGLGLDVCVPPQGTNDDCMLQAGPFVIPDVFKIDLTVPTGAVAEGVEFPNGRRPTDPVIDPILAVLLLDISPPGMASLLTFLNLDGDETLGPTANPIQNDVAFEADFPYLAAPHE